MSVHASAESLFAHRKLLLAPMAGVSDEAFRQVCKEQGADITYTEMVSAKGLSFANEKTKDLLRKADNEEKIAVQIFGHEPQVMADQARWIEDYLGDDLAYLDINMGCPARKIVSKGDGCVLMTTPVLASQIIEKVARSVSVPVTVKFRRGYSMGEESAVDFARMAEGSGARAVAVHGRYAEQLYRGNADWDIIRQVKQTVSIPVIGNGDIKTAADVIAMRDATDCDAFMIGRAARGNPWIFAAALATLSGNPMPEPPSSEERIAMARRHAGLLSQRMGKNIVRMRKHAMWYFAGLPGASVARDEINRCVVLQDFDRVFDYLLDQLTYQGKG